MMEKNFVVRDAVAVVVDGQYFDLHNEFDLCEIKALLGEGRVILRFQRSGSAYHTQMFLDISEVSYFSLNSPASALHSRDVIEIGYKNPDDFDHDWLLPEANASPEDHLFIRLSSDDFIRIHGSQAQMLTSE